MQHKTRDGNGVFDERWDCLDDHLECKNVLNTARCLPKVRERVLEALKIQCRSPNVHKKN